MFVVCVVLVFGSLLYEIFFPSFLFYSLFTALLLFVFLVSCTVWTFLFFSVVLNCGSGRLL
jgi:hypothetical protein